MSIANANKKQARDDPMMNVMYFKTLFLCFPSVCPSTCSFGTLDSRQNDKESPVWLLDKQTTIHTKSSSAPLISL